MTDPLEMNLRGRILLGASRHGVSDPRRVARLARAVVAVVRREHPGGRPSLRALEPLLSEQLALLEGALMQRRFGSAGDDAEPTVPPDGSRDDAADAEEAPEEAPRGLRKRYLEGRGHTVEARSMEEKLRERRQPVQELLRTECVQLGLIDGRRAERMIRGMLGKRPEDAEREVVEQLRQVLQDQVKGIVRRLRGGPWASPQAQEEMRQDIHHARSVRSLLMLARQIVKERHAWERAHGKGLFAGWFGRGGGLGG